MEDFEEIDAMKTISSILKNLDQDARQRVIAWTLDKFNLDKPTFEKNQSQIKEESQSKNEKKTTFDSVADLYFQTSPSTHAERALVVGYWFQFIKSKDEFDSQSVNSELKNLGTRISNITRAFNSLIKKKPSLVMQTKKTGSTKQARKKFKLTVAGKRKVESMIGNGETARSH